MENLFKYDLPLDVKFDLKGSTYGRTALNKLWFPLNLGTPP